MINHLGTVRIKKKVFQITIPLKRKVNEKISEINPEVKFLENLKKLSRSIVFGKFEEKNMPMDVRWGCCSCIAYDIVQ